MTRLDASQVEILSAKNRAASESDILKDVLRFMRIHPVVQWCERMNTGAAKRNGRMVKFGFPGLSDIIGQLRDGRMIVVETKDATGKLTEAQEKFLAEVGQKGVAIVARSLDDVRPVLDGLLKRAA